MTTVRESVSVYLLPGMSIKVSAPEQFVKFGEHYYQRADGSYQQVELIHGFALQDPDVGELIAVDGEPAVIYKHKKFAQNKIIFYSRVGEQGFVDVISVPIHDHSSIVTGGPAYATYFSDDELHEGVEGDG